MTPELGSVLPMLPFGVISTPSGSTFGIPALFVYPMGSCFMFLSPFSESKLRPPLFKLKTKTEKNVASDYVKNK